jgi:hypothetical protein
LYSKLFSSILDSSVWLEDDATRIVWITLLASKDVDGFCHFASVRNLARRAAVSDEAAEIAVQKLEAPDPDSADPEHDGRRIERTQGGWIVLNAKKYDELGSEAHRRIMNAKHAREYRKRHANDMTEHDASGVRHAPSAHTDTDIDTDIDIEEEGGTRARAKAPPPPTEDTPEPDGKRRAAAASLRTDGVDLNTPTTPDSIIETHIATCIPPDWRDAWREHVKLWRQAMPGDRRPEKLAWHQNYFRRIRAHCEESAPPGEEQALLVAVSRTFFAHGAAHKRFGAEIRASGYDAGHWLSWSKTGHWDAVAPDALEEDHTTFYDPETRKSYPKAAFEKLLAARKNGNTPTPKRKTEPIGVSPEGRAAVLAAMQQLTASKGLPS